MFDESVTKDGSELFVVAVKDNGEAVAQSLGNRIEPNKIYRMIYQVEKGGEVLPKKVDLSFTGIEVISQYLDHKCFMEGFHSDAKIEVPFDFWFRNTMKDGVIAHCYTKIFGKSSSTQRLIKNVIGWSSKDQKAFLRNTSLVNRVINGYLFQKIEEGFDSITINDVFRMTEDEVKDFLERATYINPDLLAYGYESEEKMREGLKNGFLKFVPFNTDPMATQTIN
jgi:c-di-GMP-related signal transduction protein